MEEPSHAKKTKALLIGIGSAVGLIAIGFVALNAPYFLRQGQYYAGVNGSHTVAPTLSTDSENSTPTASEPNRLVIPSLGINAPVQYVSEANEDVFQRALQDGVVHYPGTAGIGQPGNAYIFGHSSDFALAPGNYKTVFALLPKIALDAEIIAFDTEGKPFRYKVINQFVAENTDLHLLEQGDYQQKLLTLQTSYPLGTALRRYIVQAQLVE